MFTVLLPTAAALGVVAHHGVFIHGEYHLRLRQVVAGHVALLMASYYVLSQIFSSYLEALSSLAIASGVYLATLYTSIAIYRLLFHPLRHFPGPKLAALTKFWHVWNARDSRNYRLQREINKKYGSVVRTGPNEISIYHPQGIDLLDGPKSTTTKDAFYDILRPNSSAIFTRDEEEHTQRRKTWTQALSQRSMDEFRPRIAKVSLNLRGAVDKYVNEGNSVNINDLMAWFSFDVMGEVVFGQNFGSIDNRTTHPAFIIQEHALALLGPILDTQWIAQMGFAFFPFIGNVKRWLKMVAFCKDQMASRFRRNSETKTPDMAGYFINEFQALNGNVEEKYLSKHFNGTTISVVVASDTTRSAFIAIWWYLCTYPEHMVKIQAEIENVDVMDANALALLPHLNAVINEVLRIMPPAMTGNGRVTGPNGMVVDEHFIPPGTKVTAPKYVIMRQESAFERADDFIPERWTTRPELVKDRRAFGPFSFGHRQCPGKILAYTELRLTTALFLKKYNVRFADGYDPRCMWSDLKDQVTAQPGLVLCDFIPRD